MAERKLTVQIVGDEKDLVRAFTKSSRASKQFEADLKRSKSGSLAAAAGFTNIRSEASLMSKSLIGGGGAAGAAIALKTFVGAASALNEETSKSRQIFRGASREMERWAASTAAIGIARSDALAATGTFGNLFRTVEFGSAVSADMSRRLVQLGADLASFNNADPSETLAALRSGLIGEAEPLRRFGVLLSEARVRQEAMRASGKANAKALTEQEKALARYKIILDDTALAQGDAARTSAEFAGRERRLKAELKNLAADIGSFALPALAEYVGTLNDGIGAGRDFAKTLKEIKFPVVDKGFDFGGFFKGVAAGAVPAVGVLRTIRGLIEDPVAKTGLLAQDTLEGLRLGLPLRASGVADATKLKGGITAAQRNAFFDAALGRRLDRVQDEKLRGQVAELRKIAATIAERIAVTKDITRKLNLEDELLDVNRRRRSVEETIKANAQEARRLAAEKAREAIEKARLASAEARDRNTERLAVLGAKRSARQFRALGFGVGGGELVPTKETLRKQLGTVSEAVRGTFLDTDKTQSLFTRMRKIIGESLVPPEVRSKMKDMLRDLNQQLEGFRKGPLTKTTGFNSNKLVAGLGLTPDQKRALLSRTSGFNSAGLAIAGGPTVPRGGFVGGRPIVVESHTTVQLDGQTVGKTVTRNQQKNRRRNPQQRRGPNRPV